MTRARQPSPFTDRPAGAAAPHVRHLRGRGFTLVEMMVSIAVTTVLILAINKVFTSVSAGVSSGLALSEVVATSRVVGDQIERDFDQMVGPSENGFLVIINQTVSNARLVPEDVDTGLSTDLRSDQIAFIKRRVDDDPVTPQADNTYDSYTSAAYARVWYGHALRANSDGSRPSGNLGASGTPNQFAADWILGRQALYLQSDSSPLAQRHINGAWIGSPATGATGPVPAVLESGLSDVAYCGLATETTNGAVVGGTSYAHTNSNKRLFQDLTGSTYASRAFALTYASARLLCNPSPQGPSYDSWKIAQMHPDLAEHVSEFIVEFAGDYDGSAGIDTQGGANGSIKWYGTGSPPPGGKFNGTGQGPIRTSPPGGGDGFVFRHGAGATEWPMLIRFRYRIHDSRNHIKGAGGGLGQWFEQILTVQRQ